MYDESSKCIINAYHILFSVVFINDFNTIKELYKMDVMTGRAQLDLFNEMRGVYGRMDST